MAEEETKELEGKIIPLRFGEDRDPDKENNRVSYVHRGIPGVEKSIGKAVLLDKTELSKAKDIQPGCWYDCFVKLELPHVAFVRVIGKSFKNRIIIAPNRTAVLVLQTDGEDVTRKMFHSPSEAMEYAISHHIWDFDVTVRDEDQSWSQSQKDW